MEDNSEMWKARKYRAEQQKLKIEETLLIENSAYDTLFQNFEYLKEVRTNTTTNYNQIEDSANTLLDILKNKCDGI